MPGALQKSKRPRRNRVHARGVVVRQARRRLCAELSTHCRVKRRCEPGTCSRSGTLGTDPSGFADGPNLYRYAGNDPINYRDPSGLSAQTPLTKIGSALGNLAGGNFSGFTRDLSSAASQVSNSVSSAFSPFSPIFAGANTSPRGFQVSSTPNTVSSSQLNGQLSSLNRNATSLGGFQGFVDNTVINPLNNAFNSYVQTPVDNFLSRNRPIIEGAISGADDGASVLGATLTGGADSRSRAQATQAIQNAYDRGDRLTLAGFGVGAIGGVATGSLVTLPAAGPALSTAPAFVTTTAAATSAPLLATTSYYRAQASYNAFQSGNVGEAAFQAFQAAEFGVAASASLYAPARSGLRRLLPQTGISNRVPSILARVVPDTPITRASTTLGRPGANDVFVTAASDIRGLNARQIAEKLTIPQSPTGFRIIEFPTPGGQVASPVNRTDPGFVGGGRTAGGAREFVIPNQTISERAKIRRVR